jgi:hypothetical protein
MAQRGSGYERKPNDAYYTDAWVTEALLPYIPSRIVAVWEPAAGQGGIVDVLRNEKFAIRSSDLSQGYDFLDSSLDVEAIITNPPYKLTKEFICHALARTQRLRGFVAMLLSTDYDHGKTRRHLFGGCPQFAKKLVLTKRIVWFRPVIASPSSNHAWFMWDWRQKSMPTIAYYYEENVVKIREA